MASVPDKLSSLTENLGCQIERSADAIDAHFNSDPNHLAPVRTAIESLCTHGGFDAKATGEIGLVVNEAVANVMRHAYSSATDQPIELHAELDARGIQITLRDWGNGKCPAGPARRTPPDPLTPGGLGLVCMHNMMDEVLFTPQPRGMLLTMRRAKAS